MLDNIMGFIVSWIILAVFVFIVTYIAIILPKVILALDIYIKQGDK